MQLINLLQKRIRFVNEKNEVNELIKQNEEFNEYIEVNQLANKMNLIK